MYEMKLHDIGEGMTEGEIVQVLVRIGDHVEVDQPVLEVQTDKVCAELSAPVAGNVTDILVQVGEVVEVGQTIIKIEESTVSRAPQDSLLTSHPLDVYARTKINRNVVAAPFTRKMAREYGIQIESVTGSGPNGRITLEDLERFLQTMKAVGTDDQAAPAIKEAAPTLQEAVHDSTSSHREQYPLKKGQTIPFHGRRKQIAQKMTQSMFTIPHVTHFDKIDMTYLLELREQYQHTADHHRKIVDDSRPVSQSISMMAFIAKALTISLQEFPIFNAKLCEDKGEIYLEPNVNLGIAVNTDEGLIVPVLHQAESLSMSELNQRMKELTKKAQRNELQVSDLRGGTFTISNVGPIGGMFATPIINYPEVALLAFHQLEDMPVVRNKEIVIRSMMNFSMSFDHRVADGVTAVQFTNRMKQLLENPLHLFVRLV